MIFTAMVIKRVVVGGKTDTAAADADIVHTRSDAASAEPPGADNNAVRVEVDIDHPFAGQVHSAEKRDVGS